MSEKDNLPQLLREYREDLRLASPPPELEQMFKAAVREQRPSKAPIITFPRAFAVAAMVLVVGSMAWWKASRSVARQKMPELIAAAKPPLPPEPITPPPGAPPKSMRAKPVVSAPEADADSRSLDKLVAVKKEKDAVGTLTAADKAVEQAVEPAKEERSRAAERSETAPVVAAAPPPTAPMFYKVRREVRVPGQPVADSVMITRSRQAFRSSAPMAPGAMAKSSNRLAMANEELGERVILGYKCTGTRRREGSAVVERWHSVALQLDLLVKTIDAQGVETIEEVTELSQQP